MIWVCLKTRIYNQFLGNFMGKTMRHHWIRGFGDTRFYDKTDRSAPQGLCSTVFHLYIDDMSRPAQLSAWQQRRGEALLQRRNVAGKLPKVRLRISASEPSEMEKMCSFNKGPQLPAGDFTVRLGETGPDFVTGTNCPEQTLVDRQTSHVTYCIPAG